MLNDNFFLSDNLNSGEQVTSEEDFGQTPNFHGTSFFFGGGGSAGDVTIIKQENTRLLNKGKYHCTDCLQLTGLEYTKQEKILLFVYVK